MASPWVSLLFQCIIHDLFTNTATSALSGET